MKLSHEKVSNHRKKLRQQLQQIETLAFKCAYADPLIHGTPGEVYRSCGKESCRCAQEPSYRHGPYPVIQIYVKGKQKQISLKKEEKIFWEQAKNYQQQISYLTQLKKELAVLESLVQNIIEQRVHQKALLCRKR